MIMSKEFHQAILACCAMSVVKAVGSTHKLRPSPDIQSMQVYQALLVCDCNPFAFLKISDFFVRSLSVEAFGAAAAARTTTTLTNKTANTQKTVEKADDKEAQTPVLPVLPQILRRDFERAEMNILESLLWSRDTQFGTYLFDKLEDFQEQTESHDNDSNETSITWWPVQALYPNLKEETMDASAASDTDSDGSIGPVFPTTETIASVIEVSGGDELYEASMEGRLADYKSVSRIIERILRQAYHRIVSICRLLDIPSSAPLAKHAWLAFRATMRTRVDLFFDRHVDHWILCCLYGVGRQIKFEPEVKFTSIVDAYVSVRGPELGEATCQRLVRNIKISNAHEYSEDFNRNQLGNVITLYNKLFVPAMKDYLIQSKSLQQAAKQVKEVVKAYYDEEVSPKAVVARMQKVRAEGY